MTFRDRPVGRLTTHFYKALFDFGFLSDAGSLSFTRLVIGICTLFLTFGLLLARVYRKKYQFLAGLGSPELFQQAVSADHALLFAFPMWMAGFLTILAGHAVFPDALDFRVLIGLPITRRLVFGAKILALALFAGLFVVSIHIALTPLAMMTLISSLAENWFPARWAAYVASSVLASGFAVLAIVAVNGLFVLIAPAGQVLALSAALRSVMLCALMMSVPLLIRLPATGRDFAAGADWLFLAPPAWFVGLERWMLGDTRPHMAALAGWAVSSLAIATAVAAGSYAVLYRHFERVLVRPAEKPPLAPVAAARGTGRFLLAHPVFAAMRGFTFKTLRRSVLHQGIVVVLAAIGAGLVVNSLVGVDFLASLDGVVRSRRALVASVVWTPLAFMYVASRATRMALLIPIEPKANWVFRMTEGDSRAHQIGAAVAAVYRLGVIVPVVLLAPIQWLVLGDRAIVAVALSLLYGWLYIEWLMSDWGRLPFTCSYIPGKRFLPQAVLIGVFQFLVFTFCTSILVEQSVAGHPSAIAVDILAAAAAPLLRRRRLQWSRDTPLEFEDALPTELNPLKLTPD